MVSSLLAGCLAAVSAGLPSPAVAEAFSAAAVRKIAAERAAKPYAPPERKADATASPLTYDQFRDIRFRASQAIWRGEGLGFEVHPLPVGWLFETPGDIHVVERGEVRPITPDAGYFDVGKLAAPAVGADLAFSGFRINGPINRPDKFDEIVVFQGASYFRAVSQGQGYGLSARGLAVDTAEPKGEEFPAFRSFWIERPEPGAGGITIHALLDSPSVVGAYSFFVKPGAPTTIDVEATLYPRRDLTTVGIAPLTSMFLFSPADTRLVDYRPAVHDSDGLAVVDGNGERIWRPLTNPRRLQYSSFSARSPKGFGLVQRSRDLADFEDLEARYDRRPTAWIEPKGDWGAGGVVLIEIPTEEEIHDNVVAFWRPARPLPAGTAVSLAYGISWPDDVPAWAGAKVERTAVGPAIGPRRKQGNVQFVVDFAGRALRDVEQPTAELSVSAGLATSPVVQPNAATGGVRVSFLLDPQGAEMSELRLALRNGESALSEVWIYRWLK